MTRSQTPGDLSGFGSGRCFPASANRRFDHSWSGDAYWSYRGFPCVAHVILLIEPRNTIRLAMPEQPDWQPISRLSLIGSMIDGMLQDAEENHQTLLQASPKPHVLDDYTVGRVFAVFGRQKDDLWLFEEQLARWKMDKLSVGQRDEVDRLTEQLGRCRTVIDSILSLAERLKQGTIEKVLGKSDLELGLEFLLGKGNPHH